MITLRIDASSLQNLHCFRRFWNKIVLQLSADSHPLNDIEYGSAWHIFREQLALSQNEMLALGQAQSYFAARRNEGMVFKEKKAYLDESHLAGLCVRYTQEYGKEKSWGKLEYLINPASGLKCVEQTFSIPFYETPELRILLEGTMDGLLLHPAGYVIFDDDKTTSQWDKRGFLQAFKLKPQLRFYRLALRLLSQMPGGEWYKDLCSRRIGGRINAIFLKSEIKECSFEHSDVFFFEEWELDELEEQLQSVCKRIDFQLSSGTVPEREGILNDSCAGKYGTPCEFSVACPAPRQEIYDSLLRNFSVRPYEPLSFRKQNI